MGLQTLGALLHTFLACLSVNRTILCSYIVYYLLTTIFPFYQDQNGGARLYTG